MSNVIDLPVITTLDLSPDRVLQKAIGQLEVAIIVGVDKQGDFYFASSNTDGALVNWWLDKAKKRLLEVGK